MLAYSKASPRTTTILLSAAISAPARTTWWYSSGQAVPVTTPWSSASPPLTALTDTPVIEPVAHQEVAPGGTATVDVQITDDTGDAHAIVATSDNEDVVTVDLRGSGSSRSLVMTAQAAGTATVTLRAVDQEDAVASPVTFDVIAAAIDPDGVRDVLTYSLGGVDAGSFQIVPATGQIRTRDGISYDHEARDTYSVTVEARDVHNETDRISVDIHIVDLGSVCASPPRLRLNSGDGGLTVRWTPLADRAASASVLGYEVERRDGTGGAWGNRQIIGGRATSNTAYTGLVNGRQYDIRIRPYGDEDACDWSAPVSGIPTTDTAPQDQPDFEDRVPPEKQLRDWRFPVPGRFSEMRDGRQLDGSYRYVRTDANRGTITFEYDEIGRAGCEISLLFSSLTSGSFLDECEGAGVNIDVDFDIEEPPAPSSPLAPQTMEEFDALAIGNDNILPGFHFGEYIVGEGGANSGILNHRRGESADDRILGNYIYENTGPASGLLTIRLGCMSFSRPSENPCPREEWDNTPADRSGTREEWIFELTFLSPDAAEYTVTIHRHGRAPLTLNGFIDFKSGDNLSSFPPELLPPGSPPQASGNDLFGVDAATGSTSISIGGDSIQTILVQDGGIQDIAYQPGDWLEPKDGGNQRMMIVGAGQTSALVAAGLVFRSRTPAQASSAAQSIVLAVQTDLIALSVVCMQIEKGIPARVPAVTI